MKIIKAALANFAYVTLTKEYQSNSSSKRPAEMKHSKRATGNGKKKRTYKQGEKLYPQSI